MQRVSFAALIVIIAALFASGCGKGGQFSGKNKAIDPNVFRYPIVTSPTKLDPHVVEDGDTIDLLQQIYEGLVFWGPDSKVHPQLAEKWEISPDRMTYTFTLRKGVKFHNGREMTADDVKWSYERVTNPKLASPIAETYLSDIVGVKEKLAGTAQELTGVRVIDPLHVEIKITRPLSFFLSKLTYLCGAVLPKESVPADSPINDVAQMIGTGCYKAKSYAKDQLFVLSANKDYYLGTPLVETIERPVIKEAATRLLKYKNGDVDLVMLERTDVEGLQKDPQFKEQLKFFDRPAIWYMGMGTTVYEPFKNVDVRRAFAMAIDRKLIVDEILGGVNKLADCILPPAVNGARDRAAVLPFDPKAAKELLAKAGFPDGSKMPPLEFNFRDSRPDIKIAAESIAQQLQQNLGVKTNIRSMEWGAYLDKRNRKELQLFHMRWAADYLDQENFLTVMFTTNGPENKLGYSNPEVDKLCYEADVMPDGPERNAKYAQAEDIILKDAVWVPIYFQRDAELIRPEVEGMRESVFGHLPHTTVKMNPGTAN